MVACRPRSVLILGSCDLSNIHSSKEFRVKTMDSAGDTSVLTGMRMEAPRQPFFQFEPFIIEGHSAHHHSDHGASFFTVLLTIYYLFDLRWGANQLG